MTIKLQPGDYVLTEGMTEDQYQRVRIEFERQGCVGWPEAKKEEAMYVGWSALYNRYGWSVSFYPESFRNLLSIDEVILSGRPEIGTKWIECEDGDVVEVVAHHRDAIVCWSEEEGYRPYDVSELFPYDKKEKAIDAMVDDSEQNDPFSRVICHKLYDAGYRKQ